MDCDRNIFFEMRVEKCVGGGEEIRELGGDFYACWAGANDDEVEEGPFFGGGEAGNGGFFEAVLEFGGDEHGVFGGAEEEGIL